MSPLLNQLKLVYGLFGQRNVHSTLDFCPRQARKEANVPLQIKEKQRAYSPNTYAVTSYVEAIEEEEVTIFNDDVKNQAAHRSSGRNGNGWDLFKPNFAENYQANTKLVKVLSKKTLQA